MRHLAIAVLLVAAGCSAPESKCRSRLQCAAGEICDPDTSLCVAAPVVVDAGSPVDAGESEDAGVAEEVDAGDPEVDAGGPFDAGRPVDAGTSVDAGTPVDAGGGRVPIPEAEAAGGPKNDAPDKAETIPVAPPYRIMGVLEAPPTPDDVATDWFAFTTTTPGTLLRITLQAPAASDAVPFAVVVGTEGTNTEGFGSRGVFTDVDDPQTPVSRDVFLPEAGEYVIRVAQNYVVADEGGPTSTYILDVDTKPAPTPALTAAPFTDTLALDGGDLGRFRFDLTAGQRLTATLSDPDGNADPVLVVYRPSDGKLVAFNDDVSQDVYDSALTYDAATAQSVWVAADFFEPTPGAALDLSVTVTTPAVCTDTAPPRIAASASAAVADGATLTWKTDEPSTSRVLYVAGDAAAFATACAEPPTASCLVATGPDATCTPPPDLCALPAAEANFACVHTVKLTGLAAATQFTWRPGSVDPGARAAVGTPASFTTGAPVAGPKLVLNEVFASPQGLTDTDQGKFVEIANIGTIAVDFTPTGTGTTRTAWALARCPDATCAPATLTNKWPMKPAAGSPTSLDPGKFAVASGNAFNATGMGVPAQTVLLRNDGTSTTILSNGLTSTTAYGYALLAPDGTVVSTYGKHLGVPNTTANKGHSFERKVAASADLAGNWAISTTAVTALTGNFATPGAKNAVTP